jgi:hypothetical protein
MDDPQDENDSIEAIPICILLRNEIVDPSVAASSAERLALVNSA